MLLSASLWDPTTHQVKARFASASAVSFSSLGTCQNLNSIFRPPNKIISSITCLISSKKFQCATVSPRDFIPQVCSQRFIYSVKFEPDMKSRIRWRLFWVRAVICYGPYPALLSGHRVPHKCWSAVRWAVQDPSYCTLIGGQRKRPNRLGQIVFHFLDKLHRFEWWLKIRPSAVGRALRNIEYVKRPYGGCRPQVRPWEHSCVIDCHLGWIIRCFTRGYNRPHRRSRQQLHTSQLTR